MGETRQRYIPSQIGRNGLAVHEYLNMGIPLVVTVDSVESGIITDWRYLKEKGPAYLDWENISSSESLDAPLFAQWDAGNGRVESFSSDAPFEKPDIIPMKRDGTTKAGVLQASRDIYEYLSPLTTDIQEKYGSRVEFSAQLQILQSSSQLFGKLGEYWRERLVLGSWTTVREVVAGIVKGALPVLREWVRGGEEFEVQIWGMWVAAGGGGWNANVRVRRTVPISWVSVPPRHLSPTLALPEYRKS
ncbi:hypothetical protein TWF481_006576 [Arthrobotrys musiformis]|uniref:Uncharacterized protein n=1 Tax=Arthrobotrys musiformis TaxID=47236 RepID=A0AAV9W8Y2_9PEZI